MKAQGTSEVSIKPTDLRGILKYVPMFRDHVFVLAVDGSLVAHENFADVLLDLAVLRSLNIKVILLHGVGSQLRARAAEAGTPISDAHGEGRTDADTLALATEASALVSLEIMEGLTRNGLRCALCNGVRAKPVGILSGEDQLFTGSVDKLDTALFHRLLDAATVPLVSPVAFSRDGTPLRMNSDSLAAEIAARMNASKLVFLTTQDGLKVDGEPVTNLQLADLERLLDERPETIPERLRSKARYAAQAIGGGTPRAHILDGRVFGALLNEIFDKVGIGTMVYSNDYQSIRPAGKMDAQAIFNITRNAVRSENLRDRSLSEIEADIRNYLVYEIDGSLVACLHIARYEQGRTFEIGSVYVQSFYQHKGVGRKMVAYACELAKAERAARVLALTTQAADFFLDVCGFEPASPEDLPEERRSSARQSGRNPRILQRTL